MTQLNLGPQRATVSNTVKGVDVFISVKKKIPALRCIATAWRRKFLLSRENSYLLGFDTVFFDKV
jgi:hypothetical protein